jgi:hypothetical protein
MGRFYPVFLAHCGTCFLSVEKVGVDPVEHAIGCMDPGVWKPRKLVLIFVLSNEYRPMA